MRGKRRIGLGRLRVPSVSPAPSPHAADATAGYVAICVYSEAAIVSKGLESCLHGAQPGWEVVARPATDAALAATIGSSHPRLVVAAAPFDESAVVQICASSDVPGLLLISPHGLARELQLLRLGAAGVLAVNLTEKELIRHVEDLVAGRTVVSTDALDRLSGRIDDPPPPLSKREGEIVHLVALGFTNREIAEQLFLAPSTVKTYVARTCTKLGVGNRRALLRFALDAGMNPRV
jgi:DNA-binding NarL/FixJ family response regulator